MLTKFSHVESRLSGRKRQKEVVLYAPANLRCGRACSASVAVGLPSQKAWKIPLKTVMSFWARFVPDTIGVCPSNGQNIQNSFSPMAVDLG
jgi:hypothetical protein